MERASRAPSTEPTATDVVPMSWSTCTTMRLVRNTCCGGIDPSPPKMAMDPLSGATETASAFARLRASSVKWSGRLGSLSILLSPERAAEIIVSTQSGPYRGSGSALTARLALPIRKSDTYQRRFRAPDTANSSSDNKPDSSPAALRKTSSGMSSPSRLNPMFRLSIGAAAPLPRGLRK